MDLPYKWVQNMNRELNKINTIYNAINNRLDNLNNEANGIVEDINGLSDRIDDLESEIKNIEERVNTGPPLKRSKITHKKFVSPTPYNSDEDIFETIINTFPSDEHEQIKGRVVRKPPT